MCAGDSRVFTLLTRALQLILILPVLRVPLPGNAVSFMSMMLLIATFDFMENFVDWETQPIVSFNEQADQLDADVIGQMANIGFETRNTLMNLNTVALLILFLAARILISTLLYLIYLCQQDKLSILRRAAIFISSSVIMNNLIGLTIETYIDFVVVAYLGRNQLGNFWQESGEILS